MEILLFLGVPILRHFTVDYETLILQKNASLVLQHAVTALMFAEWKNKASKWHTTIYSGSNTFGTMKICSRQG